MVGPTVLIIYEASDEGIEKLADWISEEMSKSLYTLYGESFGGWDETCILHLGIGDVELIDIKHGDELDFIDGIFYVNGEAQTL